MRPSGTRNLDFCYSLTASALFAALYYYSTLLQPLNGEQIYGWRILLTVPCLTLLLIVGGKWREVAAIAGRALKSPWFAGQLPLTSALLGVQLWLFLWAPVNGKGLDVSLGYFLLPLTLVLSGRLVFGEPISRFQAVACLLAAVGVGNELAMAQTLSWPAFVVALGYPLYFCLRRRNGTDNLGGLWFDMTLSLPVSLAFVLRDAQTLHWVVATPRPLLLILGLGALSALALALMMLAARKLNLTLFGLLSYAEPVMLVGVSLLIGESIARDKWLTYGAIWAAILVLVVEGVLVLRRRAG